MLTFLIPLRARQLTGQYELQTELLQRTLDSILAQTHADFSVLLICHDHPVIPQLDHPAVSVRTVHLPLPARTNDDMCADKVLKLTLGIEWALARGSEYVMFTDADDRVSRRLAAHAAANPGRNGWYFDKGFSYSVAEHRLRRLRDYYKICGTCAIFRTEFLDLGPSELRPGAIVSTLAESDHDTWVARMAQRGTPIEPLPFAGAVYVRHEDSLSSIPGGRGYSAPPPTDRRPPWLRTASRLKHGLRDLSRRAPLTTFIQQEFSL